MEYPLYVTPLKSEEQPAAPGAVVTATGGRSVRSALRITVAMALTVVLPAQESGPRALAEPLSHSGDLGALESGHRSDAVRRVVEDARRQLRVGRARDARDLLRSLEERDVEATLLLAKAEYELGSASLALARVEALGSAARNLDQARAVRLRCLLRLGRDGEARRIYDETISQGIAKGASDWLAALGSAAFKFGDATRAGNLYRAALEKDPEQPDALLRLGSGLGPERKAQRFALLSIAIEALETGQLDLAESRLREARAARPDHPTVMRLHGELLDRRRALAWASPFEDALEVVRTRRAGTYSLRAAQRLLPDFEDLAGERLRVVERSLALFADHLPILAARRAKHDLLALDERSTEAIERRNLSGTRTFDGRLWDDVRGLGGLRAATGIEALDDAAVFGFDTFAHELAHQVHFFALDRARRDRIDELYRDAIESGHCLDGYAASSAAEYFGQGVEAFVSLCKRPSGPRTHGHTRFELARRDPALHAFLVALASDDPLAKGAEGRVQLLQASAEVAELDGRTDDARLARRWAASEER